MKDFKIPMYLTEYDYFSEKPQHVLLTKQAYKELCEHGKPYYLAYGVDYLTVDEVEKYKNPKDQPKKP